MYKGDIAGFPEEVVEKMLEHQEKQGFKRDFKVFEQDDHAPASRKGFTWENTVEGKAFWSQVIEDHNFDLFFRRYPKDNYRKNDYPKVMIVSDEPITETNKGVKRVVFMKKNGRYLAWVDATTFEKAEQTIKITYWNYAKDIESSDIVELTFEDISKGKGVGIDPKLIRIKEQQ